MHKIYIYIYHRLYLNFFKESKFKDKNKMFQKKPKIRWNIKPLERRYSLRFCKKKKKRNWNCHYQLSRDRIDETKKLWEL